MLAIGSHVYCWDLTEGTQLYDEHTNEPIIGDVVDFHGEMVGIKSIIDDTYYILNKTNVFAVGTGPTMKGSDIVYEDYYV